MYGVTPIDYERWRALCEQQPAPCLAYALTLAAVVLLVMIKNR